MTEAEFYQKLIEALDALPDKLLIADNYVDDNGWCCAVGAYGQAQGIDVGEMLCYRIDELADEFPSVAWPVISSVEEAAVENDRFKGSPEQRWQYMRAWAAEQLEKARGALDV